MKKSHRSKRILSIFFITVLSGSVIPIIKGEQSYSFDALFPKTWFTKATESCAQVWGAFDDLIAHPHASPTNRSIIIDAAIGRLVFAQFCFDLMNNEKEQTVSPDDVAYLTRLIELLDERYEKLSDTIERDRAYCVRRVIDDLKKKISLLAESGN